MCHSVRCRANVIALPFRQVSEKPYTIDGGLFDVATETLVEEAKHLQGVECMTGIYSEPDQEKVQRIEIPVLYGGILFNHFGHFLHESLGRLWASRDPQFDDLDIYFLVAWGKPNTDDPTNFVAQVFDGFGIKTSRVRFIESPTFFRKIYIPTQCLGVGQTKNLSEFVSTFLRSFSPRRELEDGRVTALAGKRIIVTRSKQPLTNGRILFDILFDWNLQRQGWFVFSPEDYTIAEQLQVYENAKELIFVEGSASYLMMFLKPRSDQQIFMIARRMNSEWFCNSMRDLHATEWRFIDRVKGYVIERSEYDAISLVHWGEVFDALKAAGIELQPFVLDGAIVESHSSELLESLQSQKRNISEDFRSLVKLTAPLVLSEPA